MNLLIVKSDGWVCLRNSIILTCMPWKIIIMIIQKNFSLKETISRIEYLTFFVFVFWETSTNSNG